MDLDMNFWFFSDGYCIDGCGWRWFLTTMSVFLMLLVLKLIFSLPHLSLYAFVLLYIPILPYVSFPLLAELDRQWKALRVLVTSAVLLADLFPFSRWMFSYVIKQVVWIRGAFRQSLSLEQVALSIIRGMELIALRGYLRGYKEGRTGVPGACFRCIITLHGFT